MNRNMNTYIEQTDYPAAVVQPWGGSITPDADSGEIATGAPPPTTEVEPMNNGIEPFPADEPRNSETDTEPVAEPEEDDADLEAEPSLGTGDERMDTAAAPPTPLVEEGPPEMNDAPEGVPETAADPTDALAPEYGYPIHPLCEMFPLMSDDDLQQLAEDIKINGLVRPVVMHNGQVVDGRNRILACRMAGIQPTFLEWMTTRSGDISLPKWIWSVNAQRRHLTRDQITMAHVKLRAWEESQAARQRQIEAGRLQAAHGKKGGRGKSKPVPMISSEGVSERGEPAADLNGQKPRGEVRAKLAAEIGASEHAVQQAIDVEKHAPDLAADVVKGKLPLREAAKQARAKKENAKTAAADKRNKSPEAKPNKPLDEKPFDVEPWVIKTMKAVDGAMDHIPEGYRARYLRELVGTLQSLSSWEG